MKIERQSSAVWRGSGAEGSGTLSTTSGALKEQPYSARARFQSADGRAGTNPEELVAAAHAGCFVMALSFALQKAGHTPDELRAVATVRMEKVGDEWTIKASHLELVGRVPNLPAADFQRLAEQAKAGCPISRLLKAEVTLSARLG
jgi:lipoyl-dependent peroxiredoxin